MAREPYVDAHRHKKKYQTRTGISHCPPPPLAALGQTYPVCELHSRGSYARSRARAEETGEPLYIAKGCLGCHGASARGRVGPSLAQTELSFEAFLAQLRNPRNIMPAFPHETVAFAHAAGDDRDEFFLGVIFVPRLFP